MEAEARQAIEEGALRPLEDISLLPAEFNLVLFLEKSWDEPAAVITDELIDGYRRAVSYEEPLLFEEEALFGPFFWRLTPSDEVLDDEHLRLEFLEAVDSERRRYERLQRRYETGLGSPASYERQRIPEEVRIFVWRRDEGRCVQCGNQDALEFDHIIPISRGGANTARNVQLLCERCNRAKGATV